MMPEYQWPFEDVIVALGSDARRGLSSREARERLLRYGSNELAAEPPVPGWRRFLAQFQDVLVILLLVSGEFVDRWSERAADRLRHAALGV